MFFAKGKTVYMYIHVPPILGCFVRRTGLSRGEIKRGSGVLRGGWMDEERKIRAQIASNVSRGIRGERFKKGNREDEGMAIRGRREEGGNGGGRRATVRPRHVESRVLKDVCKNT